MGRQKLAGMMLQAGGIMGGGMGAPMGGGHGNHGGGSGVGGGCGGGNDMVGSWSFGGGVRGDFGGDINYDQGPVYGDDRGGSKWGAVT